MVTYAAYGELASNPTQIRSPEQLTTLCPHLDSTKVNQLRRKILSEGKALVALPGLFIRGGIDLVEIRCPQTMKENRTQKRIKDLTRKLNGPLVKKHDHFHEMRQQRRAQQKGDLERYWSRLGKQESTIRVAVLGSDLTRFSKKWEYVDELERFLTKGGFYPYLDGSMYRPDQTGCSVM